MLRLIINSEVFFWSNKDIGLTYNSATCCGFKFDIKGLCQTLLDELLNPESLYSISFKDDTFFKDEYSSVLINRLTTEGYAVLVEDDGLIPLSLKPILKIQDDTVYYKWLHKQGIDGAIINNLHNIRIDLGSNDGNNCIATQTFYPSRSDSFLINPYHLLEFVIKSSASHFLSEVAIIGNPVGKLSEHIFDEIRKIANITFYLFDRDALNLDLTSMLKKFGHVTVGLRLSNFTDAEINALKTFDFSDVDFLLLVETEDGVGRAESFIQHMIGFNSVCMPVFNGSNEEFIKSIMGVSSNELLSEGPNKRSIFIHQSINLFDFGTLYISPKGDVRTGLCDNVVGCIYDNPKDIVFEELTQGKSWLKVRDFKPCTSCVFRWLCPSPSNIELLLNSTLCEYYHMLFSNTNNKDCGNN